MGTVPGSYDIRLGGFLLRLARNSQGVPLLEFLDTPNDPGGKGGVVSIYYANWHTGWGRPYEEVGRPLAGSRAYIATPGLALPHGDTITLSVVNDGTSAPMSLTTPVYQSPVSYPFVFNETSINGKDIAFFSTARQVFYVGANFDGARVLQLPGGATDSPAGTYLVGPWANYRAYGNWFAGLCNASGVSQGIAYLTTGNKGQAGQVLWEAGMTAAYIKVSQLCPGQGGLFAIRVTAVSDNNATWDLLFTDGVDPASASSWVTLAEGVKTSLPTGLVALGRFVFVFCYRGEVGVFAGGPPLRIVAQPGVLTSTDPLFGRYWSLWGDTGELLLTSRRGLLALDLGNLGLRDISPTATRGAHGTVGAGARGQRAFNVLGMSASAGRLLLGCRDESTGAVYLLRSSDDGPLFVPLAMTNDGSTTRSVWAAAVLEDATYATFPTSRRVVALRSDFVGNNPEVVRSFLPLDDLRLDAPLSESTVQTSVATGRSHARKLALRLRLMLTGYFSGPGDDDVYSVAISPDDSGVWTDVIGPAATLAPGLYSLRVPPTIGRGFALRLTFHSSPANVNRGQVMLPIILDCLELPESGDRIRLAVITAAPVGRSGVAIKAKEEILKALRDLRGTTTDLVFLDAAGQPSTYQVVVEEVTSAEATPNLARFYPEAAAQLTLRVL